MLLAHRLLGQRGFHQRLRAVGHRRLGLHLLIRRVINAAIDVRIAAENIRLLHDDHTLGAALQRRNRRRKARSAAADNHNGGFVGNLLILRLFRRGRQRADVHTRFGERVLHGVF